MLQLPRHTVTRIKNGKIVCRNELKQESKSKTQIEVNLSKRKIHVSEILMVIEKLNEKWTPSMILDYLIEQRHSANVINNLTIDIVKNIKRNLLNKKNVIYDCELSEDKYKYYLKIVNDFNNIYIIK